MSFVFVSEQTATCATYRTSWFVFITEMKSVYSAVRTGALNKAVCALSFKGYIRNGCLKCAYKETQREANYRVDWSALEHALRRFSHFHLQSVWITQTMWWFVCRLHSRVNNRGLFLARSTKSIISPKPFIMSGDHPHHFQLLVGRDHLLSLNVDASAPELRL
jgi:hypothetical protein